MDPVTNHLGRLVVPLWQGPICALGLDRRMAYSDLVEEEGNG